MDFKDYYKIMGVARDASQDEIKRAYRKLARKYHPDVSKEANAETRFKEVGEAYEVLKDPEKRAAYDQLGANWKAGQDFRPPPNWTTALNSAAALRRQTLPNSVTFSNRCLAAAFVPGRSNANRISALAVKTIMPK